MTKIYSLQESAQSSSSLSPPSSDRVRHASGGSGSCGNKKTSERVNNSSPTDQIGPSKSKIQRTNNSSSIADNRNNNNNNKLESE